MSRRWILILLKDKEKILLAQDEDFKSHAINLKEKLYKRAKNRVIVDTKIVGSLT